MLLYLGLGAQLNHGSTEMCIKATMAAVLFSGVPFTTRSSWRAVFSSLDC